MSDELITTIKLVVDAAGVKTGVTSARREIADLGGAVKKITDETNAALKQVGSDTDLGKGVSKATKSAIKDIGDLSKQIKTFETDAFNGFSGIGRSAEAAYVKLVGSGVNTQIADQYVAVLKTAQGLSAKQAAESAKAAEIISSATKRQIAEEAQHAELKKQQAASSKALADQEIASTKARAAALAAYYAEARNAELNLIHTGRGKSSALLTDKGLDLGLTQAEISNSAVGKIRGIEAATAAAFAAANPNLVTLQKNAEAAGTSMKGFSASMRNVPAQFTDIVVSLQGGQRPLTVLLQQGGQLKDMFGGVGNAARALGGYVIGLLNPFTIAAAAVGTLAVAYFKGSAESEAYNKTLILTGNAVGTTANRMSEMARAIDATSIGITQSKAAEVLNSIAASGGVSAASLQRFTTIAIEFERAGAGSAESVGKAFSDLANDPLSASEKLNKSVNYLTLDIYNQVKALEDQGRTTEAASVAQSAYASEMESRIPKLVGNLGYLQQAWMSVKAAASEAWDFMLNVGREDTSKEKMQAAFDKIKEISRQSSFTITDEVRQIKIDQQLAVIAGLEKEAAASAAVAAADKSRFEATKAGIALSKSAVVYETDVEKMRRKTMEATVQYETALRNTTLTQAARNQLEKDYLQTVSGITKVKEKSDAKDASAKKVSIVGESEVASIRARIIIGEDYLKALKTEGIATKEKNEGEKLAIKIQKELEGGLQGVALANKQKALSAAQSLAAVLKESDALKESLTDQAAFEKLRDKEIAGQEASIVKMEEKALAMEDEVRMYGLGKEAVEALSIARLQERIDILGGFDNSAEQIKLIEKEINVRKRLAVATDAKSGKVAAEKYADDMLKEQKKAAEESGKYWEDALMRAFESGKGFFQSLWDTIKNTLKTQVLKVSIQGIMGSLGLGAAGAAQAGTGLLGSALSSATGGYISSAAGGLTIAGSSISAIGSSVLTGLQAGWSGASVVGAQAAYTAAGASGVAGGLGIGSSIGSALAAIPGWGWAAIGAAAVLGLRSSFVSTQSTGYASRKYGSDGALLSSATDGNGIGEAGRVLDGIYKSIAGVQASLGATGGASITYNSNTGRESKDPQFYLRTGSYDSGEIQKNDANVSLAISRTILTAIQDSTLPKYLQGAFDGMVAGSMSQEQITAAITGGQALKAFNDELLALPFANLADLSFAATQSLIGFSGGLDHLKGNLASYYENFYTAEEKTAQLTLNTGKAFESLGLTMPALDEGARAAYRSMVELAAGQDLSIEANAKAYAGLLDLNSAMNQLAPTFDSIAQAAEKASKSVLEVFVNTTKAVLEALEAQSTIRLSLERKLLEMQGDSAAIRLLEIAGMDATNVALFDRIAALGKEQAAQEQAAAASKALASANQSLIDQIDLLTGAQTSRTIAMRDTPEASTRTLLSQLYATEDLQTANKAVADAEKALAQARLDGAKDAAQASRVSFASIVKDLQAVFDTLQSNVKDLYQEVSSTAALSATAGRQFIDNALANARATGYLPDNTELIAAISSVRGGTTDDQYATVTERDRDRLVLAGKLSELSGIAKPQLTAAERALKLAEEQLEKLTSIGTKVDAVPSAIQALQDALVAQLEAQTVAISAALVAAVASGASKPQDLASLLQKQTGANVARDAWSNVGGNQVWASAGGAVALGGSAALGAQPVNSSTAAIYGIGGQKTTVGDAEAFIAQALAMGDAKSIYDAAVAYGISSAAVDALGGFAPGSAAAWAAEHKLPAFAVGTNYVPRDMDARIHEGERIVPAADNRALMAAINNGGGNTERLERLVESLTAEVQRLQSIVRDGNENTRQLADQFDNVTEGGNALRSDVVKTVKAPV